MADGLIGAGLAASASAWEQAQVVLTAVAGIGLFATLIVYLGQLKVMTRQHDANTVIKLLDILQTEGPRDDRRRIYSLPDYDGTNWSPEDEHTAERVAQAFNSIGFMVEQRLLKRELVIDNWSVAIIDMWRKIAPLIRQRRQEQHNPTLWLGFEHLEEVASATHPRLGPEDLPGSSAGPAA
jgi:hypothetical protein